jgi:hypothetical protein
MNVPQRENDGNAALARLAEARRRTAVVRPRWASLAGSIVAGVVVGAWLWSGGPGNSLGDDVLSHLDGEAEAVAAAAGVLDPTTAARVLGHGGVRLGPGAGEVRYANTCSFRGRSVPHLVIRTEAGSVSVLFLRHEPVDAALSFVGNGFSGRIEPSGPGSLAVVGATGADLEWIAAQVRATVEWF